VPSNTTEPRVDSPILQFTRNLTFAQQPIAP
jgi:hypothetical protein